MDLTAHTIDLYVRVAFSGMQRVLDRLDDATVNERPGDWGTNSVAGLIVHCCELTPSWIEMPGLGRESIRDRDSEFTTQATIAELRARIDATVAKVSTLVEQLVVGPTAGDHPLREFLASADRSDASLVVHVLEELFQHLGHMEVTADALLGSTELR